MRRRLGALVALTFLVAGCGDSGGSDTSAGEPAVAGSSGCGQDAPGPGLQERTLEYQGYVRPYRLWVPEEYDANVPAPVVFNLHGFTSNARAQDASTDMPEAANDRGYVVVTPQGLPIGSSPGAPISGDNFWSATPVPGPEAIDDIGYLTAVLDATEQELCIDADREFSAGMSNGAMMSVALGCALPDRIAAIAPVAAVNLVECEPRTPVPMIAVHGTEDELAPYDPSAGGVPVVGRVSRWATASGCAPDPTVEASPGLEFREWTGCPPGVGVELYTVLGGEHAWPAPHSGPLDATETILDFFDAHPLVTG